MRECIVVEIGDAERGAGFAEFGDGPAEFTLEPNKTMHAIETIRRQTVDRGSRQIAVGACELDSHRVSLIDQCHVKQLDQFFIEQT